MKKLVILAALFLVSCSNNPMPKYKIGQCMKNPVTGTVSIKEIRESMSNEYYYSLYDEEMNFKGQQSERYLELNNYKIVPCKEN